MTADLTTYTVSLTKQSWDALHAASGQLCLSRTDTVNQAIQAYALLIQAHNRGAGSAHLLFEQAPGKPCVIEVNRPWWRFW